MSTIFGVGPLFLYKVRYPETYVEKAIAVPQHMLDHFNGGPFIILSVPNGFAGTHDRLVKRLCITNICRINQFF